ncbi:MAG TPA: GNAT family N-acetyltransferase [Anaerolineales bacterium]|nr:GNAT family N-acetyltransferase [Anaerolineales bacterium]
MNLQIVRTRHPPEPHLGMLQAMLAEAGVRVEMDELRSRLESLPKEDRLLIGLDGERLAGFAHLRVSRDLTAGDTAEVVAIVVARAYRRKGVGRHLIAAAETWALESGRARLLLHTDVIRTEANAFFTALGYEKAATTLEFIRDLERVRQADRPTQPPKA